MTVVSSFADLLSSFNSLMTMPSFQSFMVIATGWILTPERRTVTQIIQSAGAVGTKDHSAFHRFFNSARWSRDDVSRVLLTLLLRLVPKGETVYLAIDDTLCLKRGLHIFGTCMHHDPLISCRNFRLRHGFQARRVAASWCPKIAKLERRLPRRLCDHRRLLSECDLGAPEAEPDK